MVPGGSDGVGYQLPSMGKCNSKWDGEFMCYQQGKTCKSF